MMAAMHRISNKKTVCDITYHFTSDQYLSLERYIKQSPVDILGHILGLIFLNVVSWTD